MRRLLLTLLFCATAAHAGLRVDYYNGNDLAQWVEQSRDPNGPNRLLLQGYVAGIVAANPSVCVPPDKSLGQSVAIVAKYLHDHPENRNMPGVALVEIALTPSFACKKGEQQLVQTRR